METQGLRMQVKEVLLPGEQQDMLIIGTEMRGHLMFDTYFYMNQSNLNALINLLQKENNDTDVSALFTSFKGIDGSTGFQLDATKLSNNCIDFQFISTAQPSYAIRA